LMPTDAEARKASWMQSQSKIMIAAVFGFVIVVMVGLCPAGHGQVSTSAQLTAPPDDFVFSRNYATKKLEFSVARCPGVLFPVDIWNPSQWVRHDHPEFLLSHDSGKVVKVGVFPDCTPNLQHLNIPGAERMVLDSHHPWLYVAADGIADLVIVNAISFHATYLQTGIGATSLAVDGDTLLIAGNGGIASMDVTKLYLFDSMLTNETALAHEIKLNRTDRAYGPWSQEVFGPGDTVLVTDVTSGLPLLPLLSPAQMNFKAAVGEKTAEKQNLTIQNPYPVELNGLKLDQSVRGSFNLEGNCSKLPASDICQYTVTAPVIVTNTDHIGSVAIDVAGQKLKASFCQPGKGRNKCQPVGSGGLSQ
jgi:hypothetical protein